jgi:hypothetical protein
MPEAIRYVFRIQRSASRPEEPFDDHQSSASARTPTGRAVTNATASSAHETRAVTLAVYDNGDVELTAGDATRIKA